jgi:hypothetical protein
MMVSCGTQQQLTESQKLKYRELTSNICTDHQHEIILAQALYLQMLKANE